MLGVNLLFAGFALSINGLSYLIKVDDKAKAAANTLVGIIIAINAVFQTAAATDYITYGFSAAMWLFALNYLLIAAHIFSGADNWKVFGLYGRVHDLFIHLLTASFSCSSRRSVLTRAISRRTSAMRMGFSS